MDGGVRLHSSDALGTFRALLFAYRGTALTALHDAITELKRLLARFAEQIAQTEHQINRLNVQVENLQHDLNACEDDCDDIERELDRAEQLLAETRDRLRRLNMHNGRIEEAGRRFARQEARLGDLLERDVPKAADLLNRLRTTIEQYDSTPFATGTSAGGATVAFTRAPDSAADAHLVDLTHRAEQKEVLEDTLDAAKDNVVEWVEHMQHPEDARPLQLRAQAPTQHVETIISAPAPAPPMQDSAWVAGTGATTAIISWAAIFLAMKRMFEEHPSSSASKHEAEL